MLCVCGLWGILVLVAIILVAEYYTTGEVGGISIGYQGEDEYEYYNNTGNEDNTTTSEQGQQGNNDDDDDDDDDDVLYTCPPNSQFNKNKDVCECLDGYEGDATDPQVGCTAEE